MSKLRKIFDYIGAIGIAISFFIAPVFYLIREYLIYLPEWVQIGCNCFLLVCQVIYAIFIIICLPIVFFIIIVASIRGIGSILKIVIYICEKIINLPDYIIYFIIDLKKWVKRIKKQDVNNLIMKILMAIFMVVFLAIGLFLSLACCVFLKLILKKLMLALR